MEANFLAKKERIVRSLAVLRPQKKRQKQFLLMGVRIRLQRHGRRKRPFYYVVVADRRAKRDGKFIERLGSYDPMVHPAVIDIDARRAAEWLLKGAQPSETARALLRKAGALYMRHLLEGVQKGAFTTEEAEKRFAAWIESSNKWRAKQVQKIEAEREQKRQERIAAEKRYAQKRVQATAPPANDSTPGVEHGPNEEEGDA